MYFKYSTLYIAFFILSATLYSQKTSTIKFLSSQENNDLPNNLLKPITIKNTKEELDSTLQKTLLNIYESGYLGASFDSIIQYQSEISVFVHLDSKYKWAKLSADYSEEEALAKTGYRDKLYSDRPFSPKTVVKLMKRILIYYENNGYPFTTVKLDSVLVEKKFVTATLKVTRNKKCSIDSISVYGNPKVAKIVLENHIAIKEGSLYNEKLIRMVDTKLKELPYLKVIAPSFVIFTEEKTKLQLNLENKKANYFNGILGLLPDKTTGKVQTTGDIDLNLLNALGRGESIQINWRKLQFKTQDLKANFTYPFLLNTPFGLDLDFKLYKRDTTFITINSNFGIQYLLVGGNYFKAFLENKQSNLLSTKQYENTTILPPFADTRLTSYGLGLKNSKLDYRLNPRKGYNMELTGSVGNKVIKKNSRLNPIAYDSLKLKSIQYEIGFFMNMFIPTTTRSTVNLGLKGGYLINANLFQNETYRIGGLKTLRGFNEESLNASHYSILTIEWRYILEQNSYFALFWNGAYIENTSKNNSFYATPFGFGAGINFETKSGIFSVNYALGKITGRNNHKNFQNDLSFKDSKVHFGFINFF